MPDITRRQRHLQRCIATSQASVGVTQIDNVTTAGSAMRYEVCSRQCCPSLRHVA
jgi:hypothetical protein